MQGERAGGQKYAEDKPDCACCYFRTKKGGCRRVRCYYLLPARKENQDAENACADCPYGRYAPCIGFCLLKIIRETQLKI